MIDVKTESKFEITSPVIVGGRRILIVSKRSLISIDKQNVAAALVSPVYLFLEEGDLIYAFSIPKGESVNLIELLGDDRALKQRVMESFGLPPYTEITDSENRSPE